MKAKLKIGERCPPSLLFKGDVVMCIKRGSERYTRGRNYEEDMGIVEGNYYVVESTTCQDQYGMQWITITPRSRKSWYLDSRNFKFVSRPFNS